MLLNLQYTRSLLNQCHSLTLCLSAVGVHVGAPACSAFCRTHGAVWQLTMWSVSPWSPRHSVSTLITSIFFQSFPLGWLRFYSLPSWLLNFSLDSFSFLIPLVPPSCVRSSVLFLDDYQSIVLSWGSYYHPFSSSLLSCHVVSSCLPWALGSLLGFFSPGSAAWQLWSDCSCLPRSEPLRNLPSGLWDWLLYNFFIGQRGFCPSTSVLSV